MIPEWILWCVCGLAAMLIAAAARFLIRPLVRLSGWDAILVAGFAVIVAVVSFHDKIKWTFVIFSPEETGSYVNLWPSSFTLENGQTLTLDPGALPRHSIINDTARPAYFQIIAYSKKGNVSAQYGKAVIDPMSIGQTVQSPDFVFSDPPSTLWLRQYSDSTVMKGWLHW